MKGNHEEEKRTRWELGKKEGRWGGDKCGVGGGGGQGGEKRVEVQGKVTPTVGVAP